MHYAGGAPVLLNRGEFVASPGMVDAYGEDTFKALNGGTFVPGGSGTKDDYFTGVAPGSYVINKEKSAKYGPMLQRMAGGGLKNYYGASSMATGGSVGVRRYADGGSVGTTSYSPTKFLDSSVDDGSVSGGSGGSQYSINIYMNGDGQTTNENNDIGPDNKDRSQALALAQKIKKVIQDETRNGGIIDKKVGGR